MTNALANPWGRRLCLVLLGACAGLGQAPTNLWFVTILALAAIFAVALGRRTGSRPFGLGWWAGLGYFGVTLRWIIEPFLVDIATHGWMAPFAIVLMSAGMALFWGAASYVAARLNRRSVLMLVFGFTLVEIVRSYAFTGFPWALLGHIWIDTEIAQAAAFVGPHGLTLLTLLTAAAVYQVSRNQMAYLVLPIAVCVLAALPVKQIKTDDGPLVRIVQPNVPQQEKWDPAKKPLHFARMMSASFENAEDVDLVVWPETALAHLLEFAGPEIDMISDAAAGVPVVTGVQRRADQNIYHNSLILIGQGGTIVETYDKSHLVPFGEYFPGGEIAARLGLRGFASSQGFGFTRGQSKKVIDIDGVGTARPLICYEAIFAEEIGTETRPRFLLLVTNDAWFGKGAGPEQHLVQARFRAIEQGIPMVRAANTGISAMIDARGQVLQSMPLDHTGFLDVPLPPIGSETVYSKIGDIAAFVAILVTGLFGIRRGANNR